MKYIFHVDLKDIPVAARVIELHLKSDEGYICTEATYPDGTKAYYASRRNKDSYSVWRT